MILAIDIGNTNIVIGGCDTGKTFFMERLKTDHTATATEYAIFINSVLSLTDMCPDSIEGAIISSVVPSVTYTVKEAVERIIGKEVIIVGPGIKTGLCIRTDNPAQLGSDLVVNAVAGIQKYGAPLIIFDLGTATTVSVINKNKEYTGGMIMPGLMISLGAMVSGTSQLPRISLEKPKKLIGTNTVDCMKSGIFYGNAASMDGIIDRIKKEIGSAQVVATGGLANKVVPLCENKIIIDDELLINGLMLIYDKNR